MHSIPSYLVFGIEDQLLNPSIVLTLNTDHATNEYKLKGCIYGGVSHFVARIIDKHGVMNIEGEFSNNPSVWRGDHLGDTTRGYLWTILMIC